MSVMASIDLEIENGKSIVDFLEKIQQIGFIFYDEEGFAWYSPMCEDPDDDCGEWTQSKISADELYSIVREKERQGRTVMVKMDFAEEETAAEVPGVTIMAFDRSKVSLLLNKNRKTLESTHRRFESTDFSWYILRIVERLRDVGLEITDMVCQEVW